MDEWPNIIAADQSPHTTSRRSARSTRVEIITRDDPGRRCLPVEVDRLLEGRPQQRKRVTAALADAEDRRLLRLPRPSAVLVIDDVAYDQAGSAIVLTHRCATTQGYVYINEIR